MRTDYIKHYDCYLKAIEKLYDSIGRQKNLEFKKVNSIFEGKLTSFTPLASDILKQLNFALNHSDSSTLNNIIQKLELLDKALMEPYKFVDQQMTTDFYREIKSDLAKFVADFTHNITIPETKLERTEVYNYLSRLKTLSEIIRFDFTELTAKPLKTMSIHFVTMLLRNNEHIDDNISAITQLAFELKKAIAASSLEKTSFQNPLWNRVKKTVIHTDLTLENYLNQTLNKLNPQIIKQHRDSLSISLSPGNTNSIILRLKTNYANLPITGIADLFMHLESIYKCVNRVSDNHLEFHNDVIHIEKIFENLNIPVSQQYSATHKHTLIEALISTLKTIDIKSTPSLGAEEHKGGDHSKDDPVSYIMARNACQYSPSQI